MPINLEESSRTDLILSLASAVRKRFCARLCKESKVGRSVLFQSLACREKADSCQIRELAPNRFAPAQEIILGRVAPAKCPGEKLFIARIGEKFNFLDRCRTLQTVKFRKPGNRPIDQRRTNRTLAHRKKIARAKAVITHAKLRSSTNLQACAVAVIPGRRGMQPNLILQLDLGNAL